MIKIRLYLEGEENALAFLADQEIRRPDPNREPLHLAILDEGMTNGMPSVAIVQRLRDESYVLIETSGKGFLQAIAPFLLKLKEKVEAAEAKLVPDGSTLAAGNEEKH